MTDIANITSELTAAGIKLVGNLVRDAGDEHNYYAFIEVTRDGSGAQNPSNYKLRKFVEKFGDANVKLQFVLVERGREDLQNGVKSMLLRDFPDIVRNVFSSLSERGVEIWVEPKKALSHEEEAKITDNSKEFLRLFHTSLQALRITSSENVPTRLVCLKAIRLQSPVTQDDLRASLIKRGFHVPSEEWLSGTFDKLRKAGFLLRRKDGRFALTLAGLKALGSAKNSRSPDVSRALAMARRGE